MDDQEQKVGTISSFLQRLDKIDRSRGQLLFYRGHSKSSFRLEPSVYRNSGWIANEAIMLKELILRCPNDFSGDLSTFQILVKMQHYSLPTRLLDITSNPLVALYFSCTTHEKYDEDGDVIVVGFDIDQVKYFDSDTVSVISNLSRRPTDFKIPSVGTIGAIETNKQIRLFNETYEIERLLHDVRQDKPHFKPIIQRGHLGKVICVKPMLDNPRIIRQDGAFLLFGVDGDKTKPAQLEESSIIERIKVNKAKKVEILMQLKALGISQATLFPEIEQVATHIKKSYQSPELRLRELSFALSQVLDALKQGTPKSIHDVAKQNNVSPMTVSHCISNLNEMGLVERLGSGRNVRWQAKHNIKVVPE